MALRAPRQVYGARPARTEAQRATQSARSHAQTMDLVPPVVYTCQDPPLGALKISISALSLARLAWPFLGRVCFVAVAPVDTHWLAQFLSNRPASPAGPLRPIGESQLEATSVWLEPPKLPLSGLPSGGPRLKLSPAGARPANEACTSGAGWAKWWLVIVLLCSLSFLLPAALIVGPFRELVVVALCSP